ncbi:MAG: carboxypeptidase-like regulatory domain-containing protein, partial [Candidatus Latescibacteria bacterium]|nr:carboxypeptidase-like regulatory domain-containing protein [Candidatus Latescibacterota bacterium]
MHRATIILCSILFLPVLALGGTTGKIAGFVTDKDSVKVLHGANVVIEGLSGAVGTATDETGHYVLLNTPPGIYSVKCSFVGYQTVVVKDVQVWADLTTQINFSLAQQVLKTGNVLEVVAEQPLIQKDRTASVRRVSREEIDVLPVRGMTDLTALQAGVTDQDGYLYIRGGRLGEVDYLVDGVSQRDLQSGRMTTTLNNRAIERVEVITGGFDAEYGRVMSGIVKVTTREGGDRYSGAAEFTTDKPTDKRWLNTPSFGYQNADMALGGPIFPGNRRTSFFTSG